jgi:hypothetical protein
MFMFEQMTWQSDRLKIDEWVFLLLKQKAKDLHGDDHFRFSKTKALVDQYADYFNRSRPDFRPANVFGLDMWDGGSTAFWFEVFQPQKHVAVDLNTRGDSPYFRHYVESRGLADRIQTFWSTDQADKSRMREIAAAEFAGPLDLVIDDASHLYDVSRESFDALYPLLRPGGLYIIQDWARGHWPAYHSVDSPFASQADTLTRLVNELIAATGTGVELINSVTVYQGFTVIERGVMSAEAMGDFNLDRHTVRRPVWRRWTWSRIKKTIKAQWKESVRRRKRVWGR